MPGFNSQPTLTKGVFEMGGLISLIVYFLVAALVIWIVGRMNLGLTVKSYGAAIIAAIVIALIAWVIWWLLGLFGISMAGGWLAAIINLLVAALVLLLAGRWLSGLEVKGYTGAIVAAIAIGVVGWLINWVLSLLGIGPVV
jgi:putative membrane protein